MEKEQKEFSISDIEFVPCRQESSLLGFASFILNDQFSIQSVAVHSLLNSTDKKVRLVWPGKPLGFGERRKYRFYFRPLDSEIEEKIRKAVEEKLEELGFFKP